MRIFDFSATLKYIGLKSKNLLFPKETVFIGLIYPPSPQGGFCKYQEINSSAKRNLGVRNKRGPLRYSFIKAEKFRALALIICNLKR